MHTESDQTWNGGNTPYLRKKRLTQLVALWHLIKTKTPDIENCWEFCEHTAAICIEDYLRSRDEVMHKLGITDRIQRPKIAGLLVSSMLRHPPIRVKRGAGAGLTNHSINERAAFLLGLSICAEPDLQKFSELRAHPQFAPWFEGQVHYLSQSHAQAKEAMMMVFEAISLAFFPANLVV